MYGILRTHRRFVVGQHCRIAGGGDDQVPEETMLASRACVWEYGATGEIEGLIVLLC